MLLFRRQKANQTSNQSTPLYVYNPTAFGTGYLIAEVIRRCGYNR